MSELSDQHFWRNDVGGVWTPNEFSDKCAVCGHTPDAHPYERPTSHAPNEPHRYHIVCTVCGEPGVIRVSVDPERVPVEPETYSDAIRADKPVYYSGDDPTWLPQDDWSCGATGLCERRKGHEGNHLILVDGVFAATEPNPPRDEQPERFALRYSGQHDDCIATVPHYHDRPYQLGDWSAEPAEVAPGLREACQALVEHQVGLHVLHGHEADWRERDPFLAAAADAWLKTGRDHAAATHNEWHRDHPGQSCTDALAARLTETA